MSLCAEQSDEPAGDGLEESVARLVAQRVVGVLEVVEVDEEGGHRVTGAPCPDQHLVGPVQDQLAVGQSGQRVVQGAVGEELLELLPLGDVADVGDVAGHRGPVELVGDHGLDVAAGAVPPDHAELEDGGVRRGLELLAEAQAQVVLVVRVDVVGGHPADQRQRPVAEQLLDGGREVAEDPLAVDDHGHVRGVLDQRAEAVLAQPDGRLGVLLLLHGGAGHADHEDEDEGAHDGQRHRLPTDSSVGSQPIQIPISPTAMPTRLHTATDSHDREPHLAMTSRAMKA